MLGFGGAFLILPMCYYGDGNVVSWYMAIGGFAYSGGVYFFLQNDQPMYHVIWHVFVFTACIIHYLGLEKLVKIKIEAKETELAELALAAGGGGGRNLLASPFAHNDFFTVGPDRDSASWH